MHQANEIFAWCNKNKGCGECYMKKTAFFLGAICTAVLICLFFTLGCLPWGRLIKYKHPSQQYGTTWKCRQTEWPFYVPDTEGPIYGTIISDNINMTVEIAFFYSEIHVWDETAVSTADRCFEGRCRFYDDKFIIYDIEKDTIFNFEYKELIFDLQKGKLVN